jgi:RimJ/RimL family protein N-acetyltransferase
VITAVGPAAGIEGRVIARGERVNLRALIPADRPHLQRWASDPALDYLAGSEFLRAYRDASDQAGFLDAGLADPTQVVFIVVPAHDRTEPLGLVRLFNIHPPEGYAFLETLIANRRAVGRGFGIEAGKLICAWGLDVLGLERVEAKVYAYNRLSINALKRNGFRLEGVLRRAGLQDGRRCDMLVFGILREELEAQRQKESNPERFSFVEGDL